MYCYVAHLSNVVFLAPVMVNFNILCLTFYVWENGLINWAQLMSCVLWLSGSVEERSTASSYSTWRNIVQRCACASKIPTAIAITAASSRAQLWATPTPPTMEEFSSPSPTCYLAGLFFSHCVQVFYFEKSCLVIQLSPSRSRFKIKCQKITIKISCVVSIYNIFSSCAPKILGRATLSRVS